MRHILHRRIATLSGVGGVGGDGTTLDLFRHWETWLFVGGGATIGWFLGPAMSSISVSSLLFGPPSLIMQHVGGAVAGGFFGFIGLFFWAISTSAEM